MTISTSMEVNTGSIKMAFGLMQNKWVFCRLLCMSELARSKQFDLLLQDYIIFVLTIGPRRAWISLRMMTKDGMLPM